MSEVIGIRRRQFSPPITWPYLQTIHVERAAKTEDQQSFNESTTEAEQITQIQQDNNKQIYGQNWGGQTFKNVGTKLIEISAVTIKAAKTGSPPENLVVEIRDAVMQEAEVTEWYVDSTDTFSPDIYGNRMVGESFPVYHNGKLTKVKVKLQSVGTITEDVVVRVYATDPATGKPTGSPLAEAEIPYTSITGTYAFIQVDFSTQPSVESDKNYAVTCHCENWGGDASNRYEWSQSVDRDTNAKTMTSTDQGSSWTPSDYDLNLYVYVNAEMYRPGSMVLGSVEFTPGEIAGSPTDKKGTLATEVLIAPGQKLALCMYQKNNGGDASNYYMVYFKGANVYIVGDYSESADSGTSWTFQNGYDFYFKIHGVMYIKIYEGTVNIEEILASAVKGRLEIQVNAKANSGTVKLAGVVDDGTEHTSTSSQEPTTKVVFDKKTDFTAQDTAVPWKVYANGDGVAYYYTLQRCHYYNKNPITPGDFGKHALILWSYKLLIGDELKFDASFHHILPNLEEGNWEGSFENAPGDIFVAQVEVITGSPTLVFLGW